MASEAVAPTRESARDRLLRALATPRLQGFWQRLDLLALRGMNLGGNATLQGNGELGVLRLVRGIAGPGPLTVVDAGANVGEYAVAALDVLGQGTELHCFEPSATAFAKLSIRLAGRAGVHLHRAALGASDDEVALWAERPGSSGASLYQRDAFGASNAPVETARVEQADLAFSRLGLDRVDLLKLDVEGHEFAILSTLTTRLAAGAVRVVQFEFGGSQVDARVFLRDFVRLLEPSHVLLRVLPNGLHPLGPYRTEDERFAYSTYVAVHRPLWKPAAPDQGDRRS